MIYRLLMALVAIACVGCSSSGDYDYSLFPVRGSDSKWGYVDGDGKISIGYQFSEAYLFRDGLALVKSHGDDPMYGFINKEGTYVVQPKYVSATSFHEGIAFVTPKNGQPVAIDSKGETAFTCKDAEGVAYFSDGLAGFRNKAGKWGFYSSKGEIAIAPQFKEAGLFTEGLCAVRNDEGKWGYINKEGKIVVTHQFDAARPFANSHAAVSSSGKWGVIDKDGKYKINPQYSQAYVDGSSVLVSQDGKYGWVDLEGKVIINPQFERAYPFGNGKLAAVVSGSKYGYIDADAKLVIQPQFDNAAGFTGKVAIIVMDGKIGLIDGEGKIAVNPQFEGISVGEEVLYNKQTINSYNDPRSWCSSDFVDIPAIINAVKSHFNGGKVLGVDFNSTAQDLLTTFGMSASDMSPYNSSLTCKQDSIGSDATYSLSANIGYGSEPTTQPYSYDYQLSLMGRAANKSADIFKELANAFGSFQKDAAASTETMYVFKGNGIVLTINSNGSTISIRINRESPVLSMEGE